MIVRRLSRRTSCLEEFEGGNRRGKEMVCEMLACSVWIKSLPSSIPPRRLLEVSTDCLKAFRFRRPRLIFIPNRLVAVTISLVLRLASRSAVRDCFLAGDNFRVASITASELSEGVKLIVACCQAPIRLKRLSVLVTFSNLYTSPGREQILLVR